MVLARYPLIRPNPEHYRLLEGSRLALIAAAVSALCAAAVFFVLVLQEGPPFSFAGNRAHIASLRQSTPASASVLQKPVPAPVSIEQKTAAPAKPDKRRLVFSLTRSRHFQHLGSVGVEVRRIDAKRGNYDVTLLVNRRRTTKRHVRLNEPIALKSTKASGVISELVVNEIERDRVSGYISELVN